MRMVRWCIRLTRLTLVCEVIRYRLVQVRQNQKKKKEKDIELVAHSELLCNFIMINIKVDVFACRCVRCYARRLGDSRRNAHAKAQAALEPGLRQTSHAIVWPLRPPFLSFSLPPSQGEAAGQGCLRSLTKFWKLGLHDPCLCNVMGPVRIRHCSHEFGWQSSHSVDLAGWQAKMASIEVWIPWRNAHRPHYDFSDCSDSNDLLPNDRLACLYPSSHPYWRWMVWVDACTVHLSKVHAHTNNVLLQASCQMTSLWLSSKHSNCGRWETYGPYASLGFVVAEQPRSNDEQQWDRAEHKPTAAQVVSANHL